MQYIQLQHTFIHKRITLAFIETLMFNLKYLIVFSLLNNISRTINEGTSKNNLDRTLPILEHA